MTPVELIDACTWFVPALVLTLGVEKTLYSILLDGLGVSRWLEPEGSSEIRRLRWECANGIDSSKPPGPDGEPFRLTEQERLVRCERLSVLMDADPIWRRKLRFHFGCTWCRMLVSSIVVCGLLPSGLGVAARIMLALGVPVFAAPISIRLGGDRGRTACRSCGGK